MKIEFSGEIMAESGLPVVKYNRKVLQAALQPHIGEKVRIIIQTERSIGKNDKFHKLVRIMATSTGESFEGCKLFLKKRFLGTETTIAYGEEITEIRKSSSLSDEEMAMFISEVEYFIETVIKN